MMKILVNFLWKISLDYFEEGKGLKDLILVIGKLVYRQLNVQETKAKKGLFHLLIIVKFWEREYIRLRTIESISRYRSISQRWRSHSKKKEYICRWKNRV